MARTKVYRYSAESLRRFKWQAVIVGVAIAVVIIGVAAAISLGDPKNALALMVVGFMLAAVADCALALGVIALYRAARDRTAVVSATAIERRQGSIARYLPFESMRVVCIWRLRSGEVVAVAARAEEGKPLHLSGFDGMESIAERLRGAVPPECEIRERRHLLDWGHPLVLLAGIGAACAAVLVIWMLPREIQGRPALPIVEVAWWYGIGLLWLVYRPSAHSMLRRFSWPDLLMGLLGLFNGTLYLIDFLLMG